ncbi:MAG: hypothetical protein JRN24_00220 [Nitrososphaerota archaeon]|nr:hypothetical protein [Nitrososphaerota archaeon]
MRTAPTPSEKVTSEMANVRKDIDKLFGKDPESIRKAWDAEWQKVEAHLESTASQLEEWGKKHLDSVTVSVSINLGLASASVTGSLKP